MTEKIKLQRLDDTPWGFRLTGGLDFGTSITVVKVTGGSIAALAGIKVGDLVIEINGASTKNLTHTEAQNWILRSGNLLYFTVIRGSIVTPPSTPFRGTTPVKEIVDSGNGLEYIQNGDYISDHYEHYSDSGGACLNDGTLRMEELTEREYTLLNGGEVPCPVMGFKIASGAVSDLELDELLTGNEEVLDQGLLGINFQKYFPQVDFIRKSEVFKLLQDENTHKELPEEVQLEIDPAKRFSTFLQKPKVPQKPRQVGRYWHYPKAPNYLPRSSMRMTEQPRRRKDEHSVLWLFLRKEGDKVIDERWGTPEEERKNVSRNTNRDDEGIIMPPLSHRNTPCSDVFFDQDPYMKDIFKPESKPIYMEAPPLKEKAQVLPQLKDPTTLKEVPATPVIKEIETMKKLDDTKAEYGKDSLRSDIIEEPIIASDFGYPCGNLYEENEIEIINGINEFDEESMQDVEMTKYSGNEVDMTTEEMQKTFQGQLAKIQVQISELEGKAPKDVISQLIEVQDQLKRILELNKVSLKQEDEVMMKEEMEQEIFFQTELEQESSMSAASDSEYVMNYTINPYQKKKDVNEEFTIEINNIKEKPALKVIDMNVEEDQQIEKFEIGDFEVCDTEEEKTKLPPEPLKKSFHPLTPAARPIVLPGGRQWRKPKDAAHNDFYQGILVEQAEVLIGTNKSVNFKKYVPPKFDTDASPVCKLIRELEEKTEAKERKPEDEYYQAPLTKRHFYNATLPQPAPVGTVELKDLF